MTNTDFKEESTGMKRPIYLTTFVWTYFRSEHRCFENWQDVLTWRNDLCLELNDVGDDGLWFDDLDERYQEAVAKGDEAERDRLICLDWAQMQDVRCFEIYYGAPGEKMKLYDWRRAADDSEPVWTCDDAIG